MPKRNRGVERFKRWKTKTEPDTTYRLLQLTREVAVEQEMEWQPRLAELNAFVKEVCSKYGVPAIYHHYYVHYAQELWELATHHRLQGRPPEAIAVYLKWRLKGLPNDEAMREIARKLGFDIPAIEEISKQYLGVYMMVVAKGIPWGMPVVIVGKTVPFYLHAEAPGMTIRCRIRKPDGTVQEVTMQDVGNGDYKVDVYVDQEGPWLLEAIFPDGDVRKKEFYAIKGQA